MALLMVAPRTDESGLKSVGGEHGIVASKLNLSAIR